MKGVELTVVEPDGDKTRFDTQVARLASGGFVVIYNTQNGFRGGPPQPNLTGQIFDANGNKVGAAFTVSTRSFQIAEGEVTPLASGGFVVTYYQFVPGIPDERSVLAQVFDAAGNKLGSELTVGTPTGGTQEHPSVSALPNGGFVITWVDYGNDFAGFGRPGTIEAQIFDPNGNPVGAEFAVEFVRPFPLEVLPTVATLGGGGFVITWSDGDVKAQLFDGSGNKVGGVFLVNSTSEGLQDVPRVASLSSGGFVVTWTDANGDGDGSGVRAQVFDAAGSKVGGESLVNTDVQGPQGRASVTGLPDGGFVITWDNLATVSGQRFDGNGNKVGLEFIVDSGGPLGHGQSSVTTLASGEIAVSWVDSRFDPANSHQPAAAVSVKTFDLAPFVAGGDGNDVLVGTAGADRILIGGAGHDQLYGLAGDDELQGGTGEDHIDGAEGNDVLFGGGNRDYMFGGAGADHVATGSGNDIVFAGDGADQLLGEAGDDYLDGGSEDDLIYGGDGSDDLRSGAGNNQLFGGAGRDYLFGGDGRNFLYGEDGDDYIDSGTGTDTRAFGGPGNDLMVGGENSQFFFGGVGNDEIRGGGGADQILGGAGDDLLYGEAGDDILDGFEGNNVMFGDGGADRLFGDSGQDHMDGGVGDDFLSAGPGRDYMFGGADNDVMDGDFHNDIIFGEAGNDTLLGGPGIGQDYLNGGSGDDILQGDLANDVLIGGEGADRFEYKSLSDSHVSTGIDIISDFNGAAGDRIDLSRIDANRNTEGDDPFTFIGTGAFTGKAGELRHEVINGFVNVLADTNGDGVADLQIVLAETTPLRAEDFIL